MQSPSDSTCTIQHLDWDSDFFGFPVARINVPSMQNSNLQDVVSAVKASAIKLTYLFCEEKIPEFDARQLGCKLVDCKVLYSQELPSKPPLKQPNVLVREAKSGDEGVLAQLAILSGQYSRFSVDDRIPPEKFRSLYTQWMEASIKGLLADTVYVAINANDSPTGVVTVKKEHKTLSIGLIAVLPENRGQGVGESLIQNVLSSTWGKNCEHATVVTQSDNLPACRLYEKNGYSVTKTDYVYHLWS